MNRLELDRLAIVRDASEKRLRRKDAADMLSLSYRQLQRLITAYRRHGPSALAHGNRGKPSSNRIDENVRVRALSIIRRLYHDFGPSLAHEKLLGNHKLCVSLETLRQWMIADGLWVPHTQ
ncbi:helix-turn-helix domain-containing protein [Vibrio penaeicida]|uniref:helix-turn-helix domain-containing protein n=1 Tax=Vibrio penaeicida TaxID=104609 RepID=UPI00142E6AE3|nr:helix-turn-helix domain-containing protein [Vibrio penaeicida]